MHFDTLFVILCLWVWSMSFKDPSYVDMWMITWEFQCMHMPWDYIWFSDCLVRKDICIYKKCNDILTVSLEDV